MGKLYHGFRDPMLGPVVEVVTRRKSAFLLDRDDLRPYPGKGYEWGCYCPESARLALAILADATGEAHLSLRLHLEYRWRVVAWFGRKDWSIFREDVVLWVLRRCEEMVRGQRSVSDRGDTIHA